MTVPEQLRCAGGKATRACRLLETPTPEALDGCAAILEEAVRSLEALQADLPLLAGDPAAMAEAWRLRGAVRRAAALLDRAEKHHRGWQDLVGIMSAGYGPEGRPGESPPPGRISLRG